MALTTASILLTAVRQNQLPYRADGSRPAGLRKLTMQHYGFNRVREPEKLLRLYARLVQLGLGVEEFQEWHTSGLLWENIASLVESNLDSDDEDRRWFQENEHALKSAIFESANVRTKSSDPLLSPDTTRSNAAKRPVDEHSGLIKRRRVDKVAELIDYAKTFSDVRGFDPEVAYGSRSSTKSDGALTSAHSLFKAVNRDRRPTDEQTRKDYGFDMTKNQLALVGVYQRLFWSGVTEGKLDQWRIQGILRNQIEKRIRSPNWGGAYPYGSDSCCLWFLNHPQVLPRIQGRGFLEEAQPDLNETPNGPACGDTMTSAFAALAAAGGKYEAEETAGSVAEVGKDHTTMKDLGGGKSTVSVKGDKQELGHMNESLAIIEPEPDSIECARKSTTPNCQETCGIPPVAKTVVNSVMTDDESRVGKGVECESRVPLATDSTRRNCVVAGTSRHASTNGVLDTDSTSSIPTSIRASVDIPSPFTPVDALIRNIDDHQIPKLDSESQRRGTRDVAGQRPELTGHPQDPTQPGAAASADNICTSTDELGEERLRADDEEMALEFAMMEDKMFLSVRAEWTVDFWR